MLDVIRWSRPKKPTLEELQRILDAEGLAYELYSDEPGTKYGRHKHPFNDFLVIVSGKMRIMTDSGDWVMKPGDRLDLPPNTAHSAEVMGKEPVQYLSASR